MTLSSHAREDREAGLTLVELLVSMIILAIITTMLVAVWVNLQRGAVFAMQADTATSTARDASERIAKELRAAQPNALPTPAPTATVTALPVGQPPILVADPWRVEFYSAVGTSAAADGTGVTAVRRTAIWLDTSGSGDQKTLYLQRDTNGNGAIDSGDPKQVVARSVINYRLVTDTGDTAYDLFRYAWRATAESPLGWSNNTTEGAITLSTIVGIRARVIIDANIYHAPKYIDTTTTVRLRNASGG